MTRSTPPPAAAQQAALSAAFSRAVDLSALKRPAEPPRTAAAATPAGPASPYVVDVTEATFGTDVVEKSMQVLVVVDLWAEWCEPCKQLSPLLERVVAEYNGAVVLAKVDVDASPRISQAFGVQSIPTIVAVAGGQPVDAFAGALPEPQVRAWLQRLVDALRSQLPGMGAAAADAVEAPVDPLILAAEEAMEAGELDAAIAAYQQYSDDNPADAEARLAVAQLKFQQQAATLPPDAVERAAARPDDAAAQLDAATLLFASGEPEAAYELLVDQFSRLHRADEPESSALVRQRLLELFELHGQSDPTVIKWRRRLAAALY